MRPAACLAARSFQSRALVVILGLLAAHTACFISTEVLLGEKQHYIKEVGLGLVMDTGSAFKSCFLEGAATETSLASSLSARRLCAHKLLALVTPLWQVDVAGEAVAGLHRMLINCRRAALGGAGGGCCRPECAAELLPARGAPT